MLRPLLKKLSALRYKVHKGADFDKKNRADEVRGEPASRMLSRIKLQFGKVMNTDNDALEFDINRQASLEVGALNFLAKAKNVFGNLITLSIIKDASVVVAVDEEQLIAFDAVPDAGTWSLDFDGNATAAMQFNDNAAAVQAALRLVAGLEDVTVSGDYTVGFTVVFAGSAGGADQPMLTEASNSLTASAVAVVITISEAVKGVAAVDTTSVVVDDSDIKVHCDSAADNAAVKALVEASAPANALVSVTIDAGETATAATAVSNAPLTGGA